MRRAFLFVALSVTIAFFGCAQILGINDVELRDAGNAGDSGISEGSTIDGNAPIGPCAPCKIDNDGSPCALACNLASPDSIALASGGLVYWTTKGEASVVNGALAGGGVWKATENLSTGPILIENASDQAPNGISVAASQLVAYSVATDDEIRLTDGGVDASVLLTTTAPLPNNVGITNDSTIDFYISGGGPSGGKLYRRALSGSVPSLFTSDLVNAAALSANAIGWTTANGHVVTSPLAADASASTVATNQNQAGLIAYAGNGDLLAWAFSSPTGSSMSIVTAVPSSGVMSTPIWTGQSVGGMRFAPGGTVLYVTDRQAGNVFRIDADSASNAVLVASGQDHPTAIDVGDVWVVWTNEGSGNSSGGVMRMTAGP